MRPFPLSATLPLLLLSTAMSLALPFSAQIPRSMMGESTPKAHDPRSYMGEAPPPKPEPASGHKHPHKGHHFNLFDLRSYMGEAPPKPEPASAHKHPHKGHHFNLFDSRSFMGESAPKPALPARPLEPLRPLQPVPPAVPAMPQAQQAQRLMCANAPETKAGTPLPTTPLPQHPRGLPPRAPNNAIIWCIPGSATYLALSFQRAILGSAINDLLSSAHAWVTNPARVGKGSGRDVIPGGVWDWRMPGGGKGRVHFEAVRGDGNGKGGGLGWREVSRALGGVQDWMRRNQWGSVSFGVVDGERRIGVGEVDGGA